MSISAATQAKWRNKLISYHLNKIKTDPQYGKSFAQEYWDKCLTGMFFADPQNCKGFPSTAFKVDRDNTLQTRTDGCAYEALFGKEFTDRWIKDDYDRCGRFDFIRSVLTMADEYGITPFNGALPLVIKAVTDMEQLQSEYSGNISELEYEIAEAERKLKEMKESLITMRKRHGPLQSALTQLVIF